MAIGTPVVPPLPVAAVAPAPDARQGRHRQTVKPQTVRAVHAPERDSAATGPKRERHRRDAVDLSV